VKRLLYQIHRWAGIALALFMLTWFASGLVIMYASPSSLSRADQLERRTSLRPESGWIGLGEAWVRSADERKALSANAKGGGKEGVGGIAEARLVRQADQPLWLVEDNRGQRFALSAQDGSVHRTSPEEAAKIAAEWLAHDTGANHPAPRFLDTGDQDSAVRNHEALRPFHRFGVGDSSRELLISARTGEVVRDSTAIDRAMYWVGNYVHLLRPLETAGLSSDTRRTVLAWLGAIAFAACVTGLIIGWQRWRPGFGGRPTYSQGRTQPYREFWIKWHFWAGLIGGSFALLWALSGYLNNNPFDLFSPAAPNRAELTRYRGAGLPAAAREWRPTAFLTLDENSDIVELSWRQLGEEAVLLGITRDGRRIPQAVPGTRQRFDDTALLAAADRLSAPARPPEGGAASLGEDVAQRQEGRPVRASTPVASHQLLTAYDSYYYSRHGQSALDRPLPVLQVDLADAGATRLYLDPQDGRLVLRQDTSRRAYRWLWSAIHHWDIGWLQHRPLWDAWMLTWVLLGVVLGASSVVIGWKRLGKTFERKPKGKPATKPGATPARLATEGQGS